MGFKRPRTLSATFVRNISRPGRYGDGRGGFGLSLLVKPMANGRISKSWSQRVRINGKPSNIGLGGFPLVTLAEARAAALENARTVKAGKDPRRGGGVPTFAQAADKVIGIYGVNWRDRGKSEKQWRASLETYVFPVIGRKLVSEITTVDVMAVLTPIWNSKRETAKRVRQRIGAVCKWAVAQGHRVDNPAGSVITAALQKDGGRRRNHAALPYPNVAGAIAVIRASNALEASKLAIEFLILTATRSKEVREATWDEVDLEARAWTIPAERMKIGRPHRVPLSDAAMIVLRRAAAIQDGSNWLFPSATGRALSDSTLSKLCRENDVGAVPHGFRSSFRDWAAEQTEAPRAVMESALAHVIKNKVEAAYARSDLFEKRRDLMAAWGEYLKTG